jgi:hypothetical protein
MDPAQHRLAERRLLAGLRHFHRSEPLAPGLRTDALIARVRALPDDSRPASHRGAGHLLLDDAELREVVDSLVAEGKVVRMGRRLSLPEHAPALGGEMGERVERLLETLRGTGPAPPRVEPLAARLGIPPAVIERLRRGGQLIAVAPGIDYPSDVYASLQARIDGLAQEERLSVALVRDTFGITRRYAEALLRGRG